MKQFKDKQRWLCALLVLAMLSGLLVPASADANGVSIKIKGLFLSAARPQSNDQVTSVTSSSITLSAEIQNLEDAQIADLYYEVTNANTNVTNRNVLNKATKTGAFEITFSNVYLTEGMNKIVIKLAGTTEVVSQPGWIYYTPATNITNLEVNGVPLVDGRMVPENPGQNTRLNITGVTANSTDVQVHLLSQQPKLAYLYNNQFFFTADDINKTNVAADFLLQPGDNEFTIVARNNANSFQTQKNIIYNNGGPFIFQGTVQEMVMNNGNLQPVLNSEKRLIAEPTVETQDINLSGLIKVDLTPTGGLQYNMLEVLIGDGQSMTRTAYDIDQQNGIRKQSTPGAPFQGISTDWTKDGQYVVFHFEDNLSIDPARGKEQTIQIRFRSSTSTVVSNSFRILYMNLNEAYIDRISRPGTLEDITISERGITEINGLPFPIHVYANQNTDKVQVYLNGNKYGTPVSAYETIGDFRRFKFELDANVTSGQKQLKIVPIQGITEHPPGAKSYSLNISSVPYVIIDNLYNGQRIDRVEDLACINITQKPCLQGRLANVYINPSDPNSHDVRLYINGMRDNNFSVSGTGFKHIFDVNRLQDGRNTFRLEIYRGGTLENGVYRGGTFVSQSTIEIYFFQTPAPQFTTVRPIEPVQGVTKYLPAQKPDTYSTKETSVSFAGDFSNASSIQLRVHSKDADGRPVVTYHRFYKSDETSQIFDREEGNANYLRQPINNTFITNSIPLALTGDTVFEFSITNKTNITVTRSVSIARSVEPYVILYPRIVKNDRNENQATINSNFVEIEMEAENADSVMFGKEAADKRPILDANGMPTGRYHFFYELTGLKAGRNSVKFTVHRGAEKINGELIVYNTNTIIEGAQYKAPLSANMSVFGGLVQLKFNKGTSLMRNDPRAANKYITPNRDIVFAIADSRDGRVDKLKNPNPDFNAVNLLMPPNKFRDASELIWIDAGTITLNTDPYEAYNGSGRLPYDPENFYSMERRSENKVVPTERGTLTLKYDPEIREDAWKYLTIFHFEFHEDAYGNIMPRWNNIGGVVDPKKNTITANIDSFGFYRVMLMYRSYNDITSHSWARNDLDTMFTKGLMLGRNDEEFGTNQPITRGEFATLLVKLYDLPLNHTPREALPIFEDVQHFNRAEHGDLYPLYDWRYIETAANAGIVRGVDHKWFRPGDAITREDAAVMIARAANLKMSYDDVKTLQALQKKFTDANGISIYARPAVEIVASTGLIEGIENVFTAGNKPTYRFDPLETFTRAQAATVAMRVLRQQKKVP